MLCLSCGCGIRTICLSARTIPATCVTWNTAFIACITGNTALSLGCQLVSHGTELSPLVLKVIQRQSDGGGDTTVDSDRSYIRRSLDQQKNSQPVFHVREAREGSGGGRGLNACPDGLGKNLLDFGGMDTRIVFSEIKSPRVQILFGQCPNNGS